MAKTQNAQILVNWAEKKILHVYEHQGSDTIKRLKSQGYEIVGEAKPTGKIYWEAAFFNPEDRYNRGCGQLETIET